MVIDYFKAEFGVDAKWEKLLKKYWDKVNVFNYT
jgi:hypothetical protein